MSAAGGGWVSAQCAAALRPSGVVEAHALCRVGACACACHRRRAVSLGLLIGGPADLVDRPVPEPAPVPEPVAPVLSTPEWAEDVMREAGFVPQEPYPGNRSDTWLAKCEVCGRMRRPSLSAVSRGLRCRHGRAYTR
ncbi:hypothetical protein RKE29_16035 [Streptomyces sp. B1866]|uniref:hypothetical protein n=1 Tax=Streptomyces sp. B1866 TaxID=3075431 RepID=UPI00289135C2|nr:hypothetical protein [Streptomyces sp. B1866]MDT3398133.1 hypothetical protein [Streptomyces sp. B1866]